MLFHNITNKIKKKFEQANKRDAELGSSMGSFC